MKELKKIVWLASYPKSGNTWFRVFLSNLLNETNSKFDVNQLQPTPIASSRGLIDDKIGTSSSDLTPSEIEDLRPEVYRIAASEVENLQFFKVHDAWKKTPDGSAMFPSEITKAVIYIIRNPLDVAISFSFHLSKNVTEMIPKLNDTDYAFCMKSKKVSNQVRQELLDWSGHVSSWVEKSNLPIIVLRYEDMLEDTYNSFKMAVEFIGLNKTEQEIKKAIELSSFEKLADAESKSGFKEKPLEMDSFFRKGVAGDWRELLDEEDVKTIVSQHKEMMKKFGYL